MNEKKFLLQQYRNLDMFNKLWHPLYNTNLLYHEFVKRALGLYNLSG